MGANDNIKERMKLNYSIGKVVALENLKEGVFYYCPLADKPVLITSTKTMSEKQPKIKVAMFYSDYTGRYMFGDIVDNQLMELEFTRL